MNNSTIKPSPCKECGSPFHSKMYHKPKRPLVTRTALPKPKRRIKQYGKRAADLSDWIRDVARPYLIEKYGYVCNVKYCYVREALDVDHIIGKGARPDLKMDLGNLQFLCRPHHHRKTIGAVLQYKHD